MKRASPPLAATPASGGASATSCALKRRPQNVAADPTRRSTGSQTWGRRRRATRRRPYSRTASYPPGKLSLREPAVV